MKYLQYLKWSLWLSWITDRGQSFGLRRYRSPVSHFKATERENDLEFRSSVSTEQSWGLERHDEAPHFPSTIPKLAEYMYTAIAASLYQKDYLDPNIVRNAAALSLWSRRPVRQAQDRGRMGIEIDGCEVLCRREPHTVLGRVALRVAQKLVCVPWKNVDEQASPKYRPVTLYFNQVSQAMAASRELLYLKAVSPEDRALEYVVVRSLSQNESKDESKTPYGQKKKEILMGQVDPLQGIILVVQPGFFSPDHQTPTMRSLQALQTICAKAAVHLVPVVCISPRFRVDGYGDTSGQFQQSSAYGGDEPPPGPAPWLMRDFTPPIASWIVSDGIGLLQSVLHPAHEWHLFQQQKGDYQYIVSSKTSAGRPTKRLMEWAVNEFGF